MSSFSLSRCSYLKWYNVEEYSSFDIETNTAFFEFLFREHHLIMQWFQSTWHKLEPNISPWTVLFFFCCYFHTDGETKTPLKSYIIYVVRASRASSALNDSQMGKVVHVAWKQSLESRLWSRWRLCVSKSLHSFVVVVDFFPFVLFVWWEAKWFRWTFQKKEEYTKIGSAVALAEWTIANSNTHADTRALVRIRHMARTHTRYICEDVA